jgi:hypothetical protein
MPADRHYGPESQLEAPQIQQPHSTHRARNHTFEYATYKCIKAYPEPSLRIAGNPTANLMRTHRGRMK